MADTRSVNREAVAEEVRSLMGRRRVNQTRLAKALNMSQSALSRRLNGEQPFDTDDLFRIAEHFDVEVTRLFPAPKSAWFTADELRAGESETGGDRETAEWRSGDRSEAAEKMVA